MAFSLTMKQVMKLINDGVEDDRDWIVGWWHWDGGEVWLSLGWILGSEIKYAPRPKFLGLVSVITECGGSDNGSEGQWVVGSYPVLISFEHKFSECFTSYLWSICHEMREPNALTGQSYWPFWSPYPEPIEPHLRAKQLPLSKRQSPGVGGCENTELCWWEWKPMSRNMRDLHLVYIPAPTPISLSPLVCLPSRGAMAVSVTLTPTQAGMILSRWYPGLVPLFARKGLVTWSLRLSGTAPQRQAKPPF